MAPRRADIRLEIVLKPAGSPPRAARTRIGIYGTVPARKLAGAGRFWALDKMIYISV